MGNDPHEAVEAPPKPKRKRRQKREVPRYLQLLLPFTPHPAEAINPDLAANLHEDYGYVQKGMCYKNAVLSMTYLGYHDDPDMHIEYVEGWLILTPEYAIEHGWLEVEGEVVDVTLPGEQQAGDYYAVYRYGYKQVQKLIGDRRTTLPFFNNHQAGIDAMKEAYEHLPIDQAQGRNYAILGYLKTGNASVVIPEGIWKK